MFFDDEEKVNAEHLKLDQKLESVSDRIARLNKDKNAGADTVARSVGMSAMALKAAKKESSMRHD